MRGKDTVIINGRHYDVVTGLPASPAVTKTAVKDDSQTVRVEVKRTPAKPHQAKPHRSTTLRREFVKKPVGHHDKLAGQQRQRAHVSKSPAISKFAPHPVIPPRSTAAAHDSISPVVTAAHQRAVSATPTDTPRAMSSRELKNHLLATRLAESSPPKAAPKKPRKLRGPARVSSVMAASFAIMVLGGYMSYISMPGLSVRVAAAQSGVDASYPGYTPSGYRFSGPVAFQDGQVSVRFAANGGTLGYQILQKKSSWDSQAVLDNYVAAKTSAYDINSSGGLTVYTYGKNAAWVNHGVLYTIEGNAPLRTDQVLKIAQSL